MTAVLSSLALIVVATLSPGPWTDAAARPGGPGGSLADVILNVALFAPFGAALGRWGRSPAVTLLIGGLLASGLELAQLVVPGRITSLRDVGVDAAGTLAGWLLWRSRAAWIRPAPRAARRLAVAAACLASAVIVGTGLLLAPAPPGIRYFGHWTPEFDRVVAYRGQVLEAAIGGAPISPGPIRHSTEVRDRLLARAPLRLRAVAGPAPDGFAPLLAVMGRGHEVMMLAVDGNDLVYRFHTRGGAMGLDSPELRAPDAMDEVHAGDRLVIEVRPDGRGYCVDVNGVTTCGVGFTAGSGWELLLYRQALAPALHDIVSLLWIAALALPVGYWTRAGWESGLAAGWLAAALLVLPSVSGLALTPPAEIAAAFAGLAGGMWLRPRHREPMAPRVPTAIRSPSHLGGTR